MEESINSHLITYLQEKHSNNIDNLTYMMNTIYGIHVKQEKDLFLFKYGITNVDWSEPISRECRGIICRYHNNNWSIVSRPFDKFFNQHEIHCSVHDPDVFNDNIKMMTFYDKADGSLIQVWYDNMQKQWRISSSGCITTKNAYDSEKTFEQIFRETLVGKFEKLAERLDKNFTYLFELCTDENHIVSFYNTNRVYLLSIRNTQTGEYKNKTQLRYAWLNMTDIYPLDISHHLDIGNNNTLSDIINYVNNDYHIEGVTYPEGIVVYLENIPVAKIKRQDYLKIFKIVNAGNEKSSKKTIIATIINQNFDDIEGFLTDKQKEYANKKKHFFRKHINIVFNDIKDIQGDYATQKDFALSVQEKFIGLNMWMRFCFKNKKMVEQGLITEKMLFEYMQNNLEKFVNYSKDW
ncbi:MAG: hypothetical protein DRN27_08365 [Thermoplasmata archaeon]|nr:MAG: hypothetical protein DRN27_08365 [Thermoplasmata archaeon]